MVTEVPAGELWDHGGMNIWQADFYRRPLRSETGDPLWELLMCDAAGGVILSAFCLQREANSLWLTQQIQTLGEVPDRIQVFRPQCLSLLQAACQPLGVAVEATRGTAALKRLVTERYGAIELEKPPPVPLPENLWGEQWRFGAIEAQDLVAVFGQRMIPIREMPESLLPVNLNLPSTLLIPGVIIDGGRLAMRLARWVEEARPWALQSIPGEPDGLVLEAGLSDRWILTTFDDADVVAAARTFRERQGAAKGLHFLLVQPDDSGMTYSGFWLLRES
jgi:RNA-binding protein Tab2/Atab2